MITAPPVCEVRVHESYRSHAFRLSLPATRQAPAPYAIRVGQLDSRVKAGQPVPLVDLRIVDQAMRDLPRDGQASGEVVVRAPWLTQGYLGDPESSEQLWRGGYLHTGDIGNIDADGYLQITDRLKDIIKSGGEWISSAQIEDIPSQYPGVEEAAVIGVPDERWGERPVAVIVPKPAYADTLTEDAIKAFVAGYAKSGVISDWRSGNTCGNFDARRARRASSGSPPGTPAKSTTVVSCLPIQFQGVRILLTAARNSGRSCSRARISTASLDAKCRPMRSTSDGYRRR
jgi:acyl-CoA synthetase (AMP-forming)/AMP-acid ligase II